MNILFLDDDPKRADKFLKDNPEATWVDTASRCKTSLLENDWDAVYLDHDLGGKVYVDPSEENTGSEVVRFIVANQEQLPKHMNFIVHSLNFNASLNMIKELRNIGYTALYKPFGSLDSPERDKLIDAIIDPDSLDFGPNIIYF